MGSNDSPDIDSFRIVDDSIIDSITAFFDLPAPSEDTYQYAQENSSVTLQQAQSALANPSAKYHYFQDNAIVAIKDSDINAYIDLFRPSLDPGKASTSFLANAKKNSPRHLAASYLSSRRLVPASMAVKPRKKRKSKSSGDDDDDDDEAEGNPYFRLWASACRALGFVGPLSSPGYADPRAAAQSHPLLPVFMHHFGCAVPTREALAVIKHVAQQSGRDTTPSEEKGTTTTTTTTTTGLDGSGATVLDVGCGNGYWTALLRREGVPVIAVDDGSSSWRNVWVGDIVKSDAVSFLKKRGQTHHCAKQQRRRQRQRQQEGRGDVLLLVYPIAGQGLTTRIVDAFRGDVVVVVGTQNGNRYTAFADRTVESFFAARLGWEMRVRLPMPSFPGKDDALYVFAKEGVI